MAKLLKIGFLCIAGFFFLGCSTLSLMTRVISDEVIYSSRVVSPAYQGPTDSEMSEMEASMMYYLVESSMVSINFSGGFAGVDLGVGEGVRYQYLVAEDEEYFNTYYFEMALVDKQQDHEIWYFGFRDFETKNEDWMEYETMIGSDGKIKELWILDSDSNEIRHFTYYHMQDEMQPVLFREGSQKSQQAQMDTGGLYGSVIGTETVRVSGNRFSTQVYEQVIPATDGTNGVLVNKFWLSDDVPGGIVMYKIGFADPNYGSSSKSSEPFYYIQVELDSYRRDYRPRWFAKN